MDSGLRDGLDAALGAAYPELAVRLDEATLLEIEQPFLSRHRIIEVQAVTPLPSMNAHLVLRPDGGLRVLTRRFAAINDVVSEETPRLPDDTWARAWAFKADEWGRDGEWPAMLLDSWSELFFVTRPTDLEVQRIQNLKREFGTLIGPHQFRRQGTGWRLEAWMLSNCQLLERRIDITEDGFLQRTDFVRVADIPVYPGRLWGAHDGVLVPMG